MFMHFFDIFIPSIFEDFDTNVFPSRFAFFFYDSSHGVVATFDSTNQSSCELFAFGFNVVEGVKCEYLVHSPLLKSCFLDIDNLKEMENVNRRGWKASKHVELWAKYTFDEW